MNSDIEKARYAKTRREFLRTTSKGLGGLALGSLMIPDSMIGQMAVPVEKAVMQVPGEGAILKAFTSCPEG